MPLDARPPVPLVEIAIESGAPAHADLLCAALSQLAASDPEITVRTDRATGRRMLGGHSEAQLAAKVADLMRDFDDACLIGAPTAVRHETIRRRVEVEFTLEPSPDQADHFASLKILFEPAAPGTGFRFINAMRGGPLPCACAAAVRRGLESARREGLVAGAPVTDFWATLVDAVWQDGASDERAFDAAAQRAFNELRVRGEPMLMEPTMVVDLSVPESLVDLVAQDLERRCARIQDIDRLGDQPIISAVAPLAKLFGYGERLRELSLGRGRLTMQFAGYAPAVEPDKSYARLSAAASQA
jgi:elongation factor G